MQIVRQEPAQHGVERSRWRLRDLAEVVPAFAGYTDSGVSRALHRLGIRLKRGRLRLHSPDPAYAEKAARITQALALARTHPTRVRLVYADEMSVYRQPTVAQRHFPVGEEPTALLSCRSNTRHRVIGGLDAVTGQVIRRSASKITRSQVRRWLAALRAASPGRHLIVVWDNWTVHRHPDVVQEARRQRIVLLWLPTYAPWLNPIEKLWRWCKQTLLHHHARADDWSGLVAAVGTFFDRFTRPAPDLIRYVGLLPK